MSLDSEVEEFIYYFYGFGKLTSKIWFIGYEEAGSEFDLFRELYNRKKSIFRYDFTADIKLIHGHNERFFGGNPELQPTWSKLIRIYLNSIGENNLTVDDVRKVQSDWWGQHNGMCCLLELFPLPNPSIKDWHSIYNNLSEIYEENLYYLETRSIYEKHLMQFRIDMVHFFKDFYRPNLIITYGKDIFDLQSKCNAIGFSKSSSGKFFKFPFIVDNEKNILMHCPHPNYRGVSNQVFDDIGLLINSIR